MKTNWLWDSRVSEAEAKKIFKDENHPKFDLCAEKLFSRVSDPKMAFSLMDKITFCKKWPSIKKQMKKDQWLLQKVAFWQTIYERLLEQFKTQGIKLREPADEKIPPERISLAKQIRRIRIRLGLTQSQLAKKLGVIQQYISRIETGRENVSVSALKRVADTLGKKLTIQLR